MFAKSYADAPLTAAARHLGITRAPLSRFLNGSVGISTGVLRHKDDRNRILAAMLENIWE